MLKQKDLESAVVARRERIDACKDKYRHYDDYTLGSVVRMNTARADKMSEGLADGSIAKVWRHSGDLTETLLMIASRRDDMLLVAEAVQELIDERAESAT